MDNSNLNLAHYHGRRAENHFKHFRYDKAIENYRRAANFTEDAMKQASSPEVQLSLQLQLKEHRRQVNLIKLKKVMLDKYIKELDRQRELEFGTRKRSPSSGSVLNSSPRDDHSSEESTVKQSSEGSATGVDVPLANNSNSALLEFEMQESSIPQLAPLELPPMLDFGSFLSNRLDKNDL